MKKSLIAMHEKVKGLYWEPTYVEMPQRWPTKFHLPKQAKDPYRMVAREYFPMQHEKNERLYGLLDGKTREGGPNTAEPRFVEILKGLLAIVPHLEYMAAQGTALLIGAIPSPELQHGYYHQVIDEFRHLTMQRAVARYYLKHYSDPAGFNLLPKAAYNSLIGAIGRAGLDAFCVGDPVECFITLQSVAETYVTNMLFVQAANLAVANGDVAFAQMCLTTQSDEARHIANGFAGLFTILQDERNREGVNKIFDISFWLTHTGIDALIGVIYEYFVRKRTVSFRELWEYWVTDNYIRNYVRPLEKYGLKIPSSFYDAWEQVKMGYHHRIATAFYATWPIHFWRFDPLDEDDFAWFEKHYPGWYATYGKFWEEYRRLSDPREGMISLQLLGALPPLCHVCMQPCVHDTKVIAERNGKKYAYCTSRCEWVHDTIPERLDGERDYLGLCEGMNLADVVEKLGYVRPDGRTLVAQPHLRAEDLWTLDDIRRLNLELHSPNRAL